MRERKRSGRLEELQKAHNHHLWLLSYPCLRSRLFCASGMVGPHVSIQALVAVLHLESVDEPLHFASPPSFSPFPTSLPSVLTALVDVVHLRVYT